MATPALAHFFHISDFLSLALFTPTFVLGAIIAANYGFLQGILDFKSAAILLVTESLSKLIFAVGLVLLGMHSLVYVSLPASIIVTAIASMLIVKRTALLTKHQDTEVGLSRFREIQGAQ